MPGDPDLTGPRNGPLRDVALAPRNRRQPPSVSGLDGPNDASSGPLALSHIEIDDHVGAVRAEIPPSPLWVCLRSRIVWRRASLARSRKSCVPVLFLLRGFLSVLAVLAV